MRKFFYPSSIAVFGVKEDPKNLAKNIIANCDELGFKEKIFPVGKNNVSSFSIFSAQPSALHSSQNLTPSRFSN